MQHLNKELLFSGITYCSEEHPGLGIQDGLCHELALNLGPATLAAVSVFCGFLLF